MSVENVQNAIKKFLASDKPEVLCIRGQWGTGKTWNWKNITRQSRDIKGAIALNEYAYVSLFGVNSINELKTQILQNTVVRSQIGDLTSFSTLNNAASTMERGTKKTIIQSIQGVFGSRAETLISAIGLLANRQIICIDDFERKGTKLNNGDILGFISYLKEERNCKVVLLLNDTALGDEERKEFDSYLEKVVDVNLSFEPTPEEIARIAVPETDNLATTVRNNAVTLGITNIRVIRKILALAYDLAPLLEKYSPQVTTAALGSLALLGWSHLQPRSAPSLGYLKRTNTYALKQEDTGDDLKWRDLLLKYRYSHTNEFDLSLLAGVQRGYFTKEEIDRHASELNRADELNQVQNGLRDIWTEARDSFTTTDDHVRQKLYEFFTSNAANIGLGQMLSIESFLRKYNDPRSEKILADYIAINKNNTAAFDLETYEMFGDTLDHDVRTALVDASVDQLPAMNADEILKALREDGHDEYILAQAASLPVSEYLRVLKSHEGNPLSRIVTGLRQHLKTGNPSSNMETVMDKAGAALREIAKEHCLNHERAMSTGLIQRLEARETASKAAASNVHTNAIV